MLSPEVVQAPSGRLGQNWHFSKELNSTELLPGPRNFSPALFNLLNVVVNIESIDCSHFSIY